jgi:transposase-like protein
MYLHRRAVDQFGPVIDVLLSEQRDLPAARRLSERALSRSPRPAQVNTDKACVYPDRPRRATTRRLSRHPVRQ